MTLSFRICTEADLDLADPPFIAAYNFPVSRKEMLYQYWLLQPDGWWLAVLDGTPVGFGGAVDYGPFSSVGMIGVHPLVQHQGIGQALVQKIIQWGKERACPTLLLNANIKAISLYQRLGFLEEEPVWRFTQDESVVVSPSPHVHPLQKSDLSDLVAFDAPYFGAKREKVFASLLKENAERAFLKRSETGEVTGYIFVDTKHFGPWVAVSQEDAEHLLRSALSCPFVHNPSVTIPDSNKDGQHLLHRYGFRQQSMNRAMRLGVPVPFRQLNKLYGEASPALG